MITEKDFNTALIETISEQHKKILVDFSNSFLETFNNSITREELLNRINKLKSIGFGNCGSADAEFIDSSQQIIISNKHNTSDINIIRSLLYHELIHAISLHSEKDLDTYFNKQATSRTGLKREIVTFDSESEYDDCAFNEGEILEEIMTEYYNTVLLQKEGIDFKGVSVLNNYCFREDYVEYHGTGYYNIAALGQIYDFLFGEDLLKAKLHDGNDFRKRFNELFDNTGIFDDIFNNEGYKVPSYSKFAAQEDTIGRYRTACKMFVEIFKQTYKNKINNINDLLNNKDFNTFLNMLVKTRNRFDDSIKIKEELFLLTKELEKDLVTELFGSEVKDNQYGLYTSDIETSLLLVIEKINNENENIDLNNIKYAVFHDKQFRGIYLMVGNDKYIIDYETLGQDINYEKLKSFSGYGFSKEEIDDYSKEFKMDISQAEFATLFKPAAAKTYIVNNNKLYNYHGEEIELEEFKNFLPNFSRSK